MPERTKLVFLSSTSRDLVAYRDAATKAINGLKGYKCIGMEGFGAQNSSSDAFCRGEVGTCDLFIGVLGLFYGSIPRGEKLSYTEREYKAAKKAGIDRLMFLSGKGFPVDSDELLKEQATLPLLQRFRETASRERMYDTFGPSPDELASKIRGAIQQWEARSKPKPRARKAPNPAAKDAPDLAALERRYLEHLVDTYRYLDIRGMGVTDRTSLRMELLEMYVPLKGRCALPEGETWSEELRLAGRRMTKEEQEEIGQVGKPQPVLEVLRKNDGVIVLGDPGAGKSTFLKFLTLKLARGDGGELGLGDRLPLLVPISAYAEKLASGPLRLDRFIAQYFQERVGDLPVEAFLGPALAAGRALVLLDGLDEVRDRPLQLTVVEQAREFYNFHRRAGNKFVLSSRLVGYKEVRPTAEGLVECTLVDFDDEEIELFLDRWVGVQERAVLGETGAAVRSAAQEKAELQEALRHNQAVRVLAANPLLLTILALMKRQGVALPEQRVRLYAVYIRTLLETWNPVRGLEKRPIPQRNALEVLKILTPLALWIHQTSPGVGLVKRRDLLGKLAEILKEKGEAGPEPEKAALGFLEGLGDSSLLLERGNDRYGFIHLTFLEYLAGYELARLDQFGPDRLFEAIALRIGDRAWMEVLLLAIGTLGAVWEREISAGELLKRLVAEAPGEPGRAAVLAGQALADLRNAGIGGEVREVVTEALLLTMRDHEKVAPVARGIAGRVLARVGDPRPEVMTIEGMRFCWIPPGKFLMGSNPEEGQAKRNEMPKHLVKLEEGCWIGLYPITASQFSEYVRATGTRLKIPAVAQLASNVPVVGVNWREAFDFCRWLTSVAKNKEWFRPGWEVRLPAEKEWEAGARGGLFQLARPLISSLENLREVGDVEFVLNPMPDRSFPWGNRFDENKANTIESGVQSLSSVGCFPQGVSPSGAEELCGNVLEWTRSRFMPYRPIEAVSTDLGVIEDDTSMVLRGGAFSDSSEFGRCASRNHFEVARVVGFLGFRVAICRLGQVAE